MDIKINRKPNSKSIIRYFVDKVYGIDGDLNKLTFIKSGIRIASGDYDEYIKTIISKLKSLRKFTVDNEINDSQFDVEGRWINADDIENLIKEIEKE